MVVRNQLKIISVADFSSHYFKEISSLSKYVEDKLNRDSRLDRNQSIDKRPSLDAVLEEIKKSRPRNNAHQNNKKDAFQTKTSDDFSLLGLITRKPSQLISVKRKPIYLKSRSKGATNITIRNPEEFSNSSIKDDFKDNTCHPCCQNVSIHVSLSIPYIIEWLS